MDKKGTQGTFDVMDIYDGFKTCELVWTYILATLADIININNIDLYRDNGQIILRNCNGSKTDKIRKQVRKIFKQIGFDINIKTNLNEIDFIDVTFNLKKKQTQETPLI